MKRQISFSEAEGHGKRSVTRRHRFLDKLESVVPRLFGHRKARYKGLAKNSAQLFNLANLVLAKEPILASAGSIRP